MYLPYIPLFGITEEDAKGGVYPMLGRLGEGHGSISLKMNAGDTEECNLKAYPRVVHYLKAMNIGIDLPKTIRDFQIRIGRIGSLLYTIH